MFRFLLMRFYQFLELWKQDGLVAALKFSLYINEEAIPVVKDLSSLKPVDDCFESNSLQLVEINSEYFNNSALHYTLRSRYVKAKRNLNKGFKAFALISKNEVIGDVWYVTKESSQLDAVHSDLKLFDITLGNKEAYLFDAHITSDKRGKAIATKFMGCVLHKLKEKGVNKAYGYFMAENVPALWFHRLLGYEELSHVIVKRCLFFQTSKRMA